MKSSIEKKYTGYIPIDMALSKFINVVALKNGDRCLSVLLSKLKKNGKDKKVVLKITVEVE